MENKTKKQLSIVVPCYNEEKNIPLILSKFNECIEDKEHTELVLVENGSTDNSRQVMESLLQKYGFARIVYIDKNIGYGNGIIQGLKSANGEYLCWTHADLQTDPNDVIKAYHLIKANGSNCFVKGRRKRRPMVDTFFTFGMSIFETLLLHTMLFDINAQPNMFHRELLKHLDKAPLDFAFDLYIYYIAKKSGLKIVRFPVMFPERIHGESNWNTSVKGKYKFIKRTVSFSFKLLKQIR